MQHFDTLNYSEINGISIQMAARTLRYEWFNDLCNQLNKYILTAHHLDDSLETFIINLTRGTGIEGLLGIPSINDNIVRYYCLLRDQILNHLQRILNWHGEKIVLMLQQNIFRNKNSS